MRIIHLTERYSNPQRVIHINSDYIVRWYPAKHITIPNAQYTIVVMSVGDSIEVMESPEEIERLISFTISYD